MCHSTPQLLSIRVVVELISFWSGGPARAPTVVVLSLVFSFFVLLPSSHLRIASSVSNAGSPAHSKESDANTDREAHSRNQLDKMYPPLLT